MRKIFVYILVVCILCFSIPIIFTKKFEKEETVAKAEGSVEKEKEGTTYDYEKYNTIKLLHADTKKVEKIDLDKYLYGVVSAEMPASFETEALKAQAVVARTYTLYKIVNNDGKHEGADICDDSTCCQAWISKEDRLKKWDKDNRDEYWNKIVKAVNETQGKIVTYEGKPINAFFHSNSGGKTEVPINVWGGKRIPILAIGFDCGGRCLQPV